MQLMWMFVPGEQNYQCNVLFLLLQQFTCIEDRYLLKPYFSSRSYKHNNKHDFPVFVIYHLFFQTPLCIRDMFLLIVCRCLLLVSILETVLV